MLSINQLKERIQNEFKDLRIDNQPTELYEPINYGISTGGKRLRPLLVLIGCKYVGGDIEKAINPAKAVEYFHNFTLLHDDIMDNAPIRRGNPTVYKKWNSNIAILSGDAMMIKAYEYVALSEKDKLSEILTEFNKVALEVCEGQQYDMNFETKAEVKISDYLNMIKLKTSVLLASSLKIGAIIGNASKEDRDAIYEFGLNIGLAFQLQDDLLDVFADQSLFGKQTGGDIMANKKTYLHLKAFELAKGKTYNELCFWGSIKNPKPDEKIKAVTAVYNQLGIKEHTIALIEEYSDKALSYLKKITTTKKNEQELTEFILNLMTRNH